MYTPILTLQYTRYCIKFSSFSKLLTQILIKTLFHIMYIFMLVTSTDE